MFIELHWDEYRALLRGEYTLLPCTECDMGTVYWNGDTGDVVSSAEYSRLMEEAPEDHEQCQAACGKCMGVGKVVRFD